MKKIFIVLAFIFCSVLRGMEEPPEDYDKRKLNEEMALFDQAMLLLQGQNGVSNNIDDDELFLTEADLVDVLYPNIPEPDTEASSRGLKRSFETMIDNEHEKGQNFDNHKNQMVEWKGLDKKECSLCSKIIPMRSYQKPHELWHRRRTNVSESDGLRCDACKYVFGSRNGFNSHYKSDVHYDVISYRGSEVGSISRENESYFEISDVNAVQANQESLHEEKKCQFCSASIQSLDHLKKHFKDSHAKERSCPICGWKVKQLMILAKHLFEDKHEEKECYNCSQVFLSRPALNQHNKHCLE